MGLTYVAVLVIWGAYGFGILWASLLDKRRYAAQLEAVRRRGFFDLADCAVTMNIINSDFSLVNILRSIVNHHLLVGVFFWHPKWSIARRVVVLFSNIFGNVFVCVALSFALTPYASGFIAPILVFPAVQLLGFVFHHVPVTQEMENLLEGQPPRSWGWDLAIAEETPEPPVIAAAAPPPVKPVPVSSPEPVTYPSAPYELGNGTDVQSMVRKARQDAAEARSRKKLDDTLEALQIQREETIDIDDEEDARPYSIAKNISSSKPGMPTLRAVGLPMPEPIPHTNNAYLHALENFATHTHLHGAPPTAAPVMLPYGAGSSAVSKSTLLKKSTTSRHAADSFVTDDGTLIKSVTKRNEGTLLASDWAGLGQGQYTCGQLTSTAEQELHSLNVLCGLQLLLIAETRGFRDGTETCGIATVEAAQMLAASILQVPLQRIGMVMQRNEISNPDWQRGLSAVRSGDLRQAMRRFERGLIWSSPNIEVILQTFDTFPFVQHYALAFGIEESIMLDFKMLVEREIERMYATQRPRLLPSSMKLMASIKSPAAMSGGIAADPGRQRRGSYSEIVNELKQDVIVKTRTLRKEDVSWKNGILAVTTRDYVRASYIFMISRIQYHHEKHGSKVEINLAQEWGMANQWVEYYVQSVSRDPDFQKNWHLQVSNGANFGCVPSVDRVVLMGLLGVRSEGITFLEDVADNQLINLNVAPADNEETQDEDETLPAYNVIPIQQDDDDLTPEEREEKQARKKRLLTRLRLYVRLFCAQHRMKMSSHSTRILYVNPVEEFKDTTNRKGVRVRGDPTDPFLCLADALRRTRANTVIRLFAGKYRNLTLNSIPKNVVIEAVPGAECIFEGSDVLPGMYLANLRECTIRGLTMKGYVGCSVSSCAGLTLEGNCIIGARRPYEWDPQLPGPSLWKVKQNNAVYIQEGWTRFSEMVPARWWLTVSGIGNLAWCLLCTILLLVWINAKIPNDWAIAIAIAIPFDWVVVQLIKCIVYIPLTNPKSI